MGGDSVDAYMIPDQLPNLCHLVDLDPSCARTQTLLGDLLDQRDGDDRIYFDDFLRIISHFRGSKMAAVDLDNTFLSNSWNWIEEDSSDLISADSKLAG